MRLLMIGGLACFLNADPTVEGPRLGYVASDSGVRSVLGIVGASRLSGPIVSDLRHAVVLPGTHTVAAVNAAGALVFVDLKDGATTDLGVADITTLVASPTGQMILAVAGDRAYVFSNAGLRVALVPLPGVPIRVAVADRGPSIAVTIAESGGEALYVLTEHGLRRLLYSSRLPALTFLPNSTDLVAADEAGVISRLDGNLQFSRISTIPDVRALTTTGDAARLLIVTEQSIRTVRLTTGEETSIACKCANVAAVPLGGSNVLLTSGDGGPMWLVDASGNEPRIAFIPEVVNE